LHATTPFSAGISAGPDGVVLLLVLRSSTISFFLSLVLLHLLSLQLNLQIAEKSFRYFALTP
jgi:hypothetical protein